MSRIEAKLSSLGVDLPDPPSPVAAYVPVRIARGLAYVSGQIPMIGGEIVAKGPVPSVVSPEDAAQAARLCAINGLAALRSPASPRSPMGRASFLLKSLATLAGMPAPQSGRYRCRLGSQLRSK